MAIQRSAFGESGGKPVEMFALSNRSGMVAKVITYGAALVRLEVPDRQGHAENIVVGYDTLAGYENDSSYFGATVGRYGNRIAGGKFSLDGHEYTLATNNEPNHLHGGAVGFNKRIWTAELATDGSARVTFRYTSPDGEEGYPGTLRAAVTYTLTDANELRLDYEATTDKPTHCNLTHHSYFNLDGHNAGNVLGHVLTLACDEYLPVDDTLIPTGEIRPVRGTVMDFTQPKAIGADIEKEPGLYDHCYVVRRGEAPLALVAKVTDPGSGRSLEIRSTEPGVQFYTANHLDGVAGADGAVYGKHQGFCLETQHYPDSPNKPDFPTTRLAPGATYRSTTVHKFSW